MRKCTNTFINFLIVIGFLTLGSGTAFGWFGGHQYKSSVIKEHTGKQIEIIPQGNKIHTGFGNFSLGDFYYVKTISKIFFSDTIQQVTVKDIDFDDDKISVKLESDEQGEGEIVYVFSNEQYENIDSEKFKEILFVTLSNPELAMVMTNTSSGKYHLPSSNHLPNGNSQIITKSEANRQGLRPCGFCFRHFIYLPDYKLEQAMAKKMAATMRYYTPVSLDDQKQITLSRVGQKVLSQWPVDLLGYDYSFVLLESEDVNAFALPGGQIFLTTGIFDALEDPLELDAILAHEIAHVENRHSLKALILAREIQQTQAALAAFGSMTAAMASSRGHVNASAGVLGASLAMIAVVDLVNSGYAPEQEREADLFTVLYFDKITADRKSLIHVFEKLQFNSLCEVEDPDPESYTHPQLKERVESAKLTKTILLNSEYLSLEKKKKEKLRVKPLFYAKDGDKNIFYLYFDNKKFVKGKMHGFEKNVEIEINKEKEYIYKYDKKSTVYTEFGAITKFTSSKKSIAKNEVIEEVKIKIIAKSDSFEVKFVTTRGGATQSKDGGFHDADSRSVDMDSDNREESAHGLN